MPGADVLEARRAHVQGEAHQAGTHVALDPRLLELTPKSTSPGAGIPGRTSPSSPLGAGTQPWVARPSRTPAAPRPAPTRGSGTTATKSSAATSTPTAGQLTVGHHTLVVLLLDTHPVRRVDLQVWSNEGLLVGCRTGVFAIDAAGPGSVINVEAVGVAGTYELGPWHFTG